MTETQANVTVRKRGRRGVAILLTLAIMSLLLILAMGFLFNSNTGKMSAAINADVIRARMLADSGLQRFVAMIERDVAAQPGSEFYPANSFYAPTAGDWAGRRYVASVGSGDFANSSDSPLYASLGSGSNSIDFTPSSLDAGGSSLANWARWVNILAPVPSGDGSEMTSWTDSRVIGRFAFLAIDETGKIDPGAVFMAATSEAASTDSGHDFREVYLANAFPSGAPSATNADELRTKATIIDDGDSVFDDDDYVLWDSWEHIVRANITGLNAAPSEALQAIFPHSHELEAYCEYEDSAVTRHRFDLRRDLGTIAANSTLAVFNLISPASLFQNANTGGIQFLSGGTLSATQRLTIAANLLDYTDADNASTTNNVSNPLYMGNEKVPYINELVFEVAHDVNAGVSRATVSLWPEFVNIYEDDFAQANGRLFIQAPFTCTEGSGTLEFTKNYGTSDTFAGQAYTAVSLGGTAAATTTHDFGANNPNLTNFQISSIRVWFFKHDGSGGFSILNNELWDAAKLPGSAPVTISQNTFAGEYDQRICFDVNDPRNNLDSTEWTANSWADATAGTPNASMGAKNTACAAPGPGTANDDEAGSYMDEPISISTAHIANKPFDSLWELGCIHRAAPWQTINLGKFNEAAAATGNGGLLSGAYDVGDAHILDQVKLSDETVVRGKLNVNSKYPLAWRALIGHVTVGSTYTDEGGTAIAIGSWPTSDGFTLVGDPNTAIAGDGSIMGTQKQTPTRWESWYNRGQIANVANFSNTTLHATAPATDAAQEEVIGKLANHLSTRSNWFSVIVCSQALNPFNNDKVLAEHKSLAVVYRDAFTGETRIEQVMPLED